MIIIHGLNKGYYNDNNLWINGKVIDNMFDGQKYQIS